MSEDEPIFAGWSRQTWKAARAWAAKTLMVIPHFDTAFEEDLHIRCEWFKRGGNRKGPPAPSEMIWFN